MLINNWYVACAAGDVVPGKPTRVQMLGCHFVLFRDAAGAVACLADTCPHRGAALGDGEMVGHEVACPYHGWRFGADGRCTQIPALPSFTPSDSHALSPLRVVQAHGLLWLQLEGALNLPRFDGEADAKLRKLNVGPYDVAASAPRIVENFLDLAHFGFVHEGWLGDRAHAQLADYRIAPTSCGFVASGCRAWQPQSNRLSSEGSWVDYRYELTSPYTAVLTKLPERQGGYRDEIALFVCPVDEETSRVWFRMALTDHDSSDEQIRAFQHTIFTQDQPVLESQRPRRLPLSGGEVHCAADRSSAAYRRFLRDSGITFGVLP